MSYIIFENPGTFDLRLIKTFGVNVKPNSNNPIGYFGTGLKYAAAIVLRNGGEFWVQTGIHKSDQYQLDVEKQSIRGKEFPVVIMWHKNETQELPFTTELGKNWMSWHAYRELYSNALDEGGKRYQSDTIPAPEKDVVRFVIKSEPLLEVFYKHGDYFLDASKLNKVGETAEVAVYNKPTHSLFYNGICVFQSPLIYRYTYNVKRGLTLSEDRSALYEFQRDEIMRDFWAECEDIDQSHIETYITGGAFYQDTKIDYTAKFLSSHFLEATERVMEHRFDKVQGSIRQNIHARRADQAKFKKIELTTVQGMMLERAKYVLGFFGYDMNRYPIIPCNLGQSYMGLADDGTIYIGMVAFDKGMKQVVATLLEEWIHLDFLVKDCTREMQDVLFDKIVNMMEEKLGEPI